MKNTYEVCTTVIEQSDSRRNKLFLNLLFWLLGASRGAPPEGAPPRERRVPPAGAVAELIREKGPTRVQSRRRRRPPYPVPSNGPPSAPAGDTTPRSKRKKAPVPLTPRGTTE
ncbi:unnamed protein product [Pleuronectes platessa]|uniref:Uncharacterized protein n=1 Tax=Pleuronectes platessa TaxID=8262 RepID=A0A9N7Z8L0_PLEPL|nr:unnamed protein product [Pleuronectes platessa]